MRTSVKPAPARRPRARVLEPEPAIVQAIADPVLVVRAKIEDQDGAAGRDDAVRLGERARRVVGVVQGLREEHDVDAGVGERQPLDSPYFPRDVGDAATRRQSAARAEDLGRAIDGDDCEAQRAVSIVR